MPILTPEDLNRLTTLAQLELEPAQQEQTLEQLNKFFEMIQEMRAINTDNIEPLHTPLSLAQEFELRLRDDVVTEPVGIEARDLAQKNAPLAEDGFFLVPKVIE